MQGYLDSRVQDTLITDNAGNKIPGLLFNQTQLIQSNSPFSESSDKLSL